MKTKNIFNTLTVDYGIILITFLTCSNLVNAQNNSSDEQTIRSLVAQENEGKNVIQFTDSSIFVSGAYPRPLFGKQRTAEEQQINEKMKTERQNFSSKRRIERIVVSQGGDMAYEFGYGDLSWDTPEKKHISFEASYLRVWRKINGEWKVEVSFARPNNQP